MIKCEYKTWHAFLLISLLFIVITIVLLSYLSYKTVTENFCKNPIVEVAKAIILASILIFSISRLIKLKSIEIKNNTIIIIVPFRFKLNEYKLSDIKDIRVKVIKSSGANGPAYIEKPYKVISLYFNNGKMYRFSSKNIKNFNQLETFCNSTIIT